MTVVVEITDQRHIEIHRQQFFADFRYGLGGFVIIDGDPHKLRAGPRQLGDLHRRGKIVGGIGIGHRLDDHRSVGTDQHMAHTHLATQAAGACTPRNKKIHSTSIQSSLMRATGTLVEARRSTGLPLRSSFT